MRPTVQELTEDNDLAEDGGYQDYYEEYYYDEGDYDDYYNDGSKEDRAVPALVKLWQETQ